MGRTLHSCRSRCSGRTEAACTQCLGDHIFDSLITDKKIEWSKYREIVTTYELDNSLPVL